MVVPDRTWTIGRVAVFAVVLAVLQLSPASRGEGAWFPLLVVGIAFVHALVCGIAGKVVPAPVASLATSLLADLLVVMAVVAVAGPSSVFSVLVPMASLGHTLQGGLYWGGLSSLAIIGLFMVAGQWSADPAPWSLGLTAATTAACYALVTAHGMTKRGRDGTSRLLHGLTLAIRSTVDMDTLWELVLEVGLHEVPSAAASGYLYDAEEGSLKLRFHMASEAPDVWAALAEANGRALTALVARGKVVEIPRIVDIPGWQTLDGQPPVGSLLALPLIGSGDQKLGLAVFWRRQPGTTPEQLRLLETLATQAAIGIQNLRLRDEATRMEALKELDKLKTELLSTVSHELRSPLGRIKATVTSLLQQDVDWDEETRREMLASIVVDVDQLSELVSNLLDMSTIEAGMLRLDRDWVNMQDLIKRLGRRWRAAGTHDIRLDVPSRLPAVFVDERRVAQVLNNLVDNAMKFSPPGSRITVSARADGEWLEMSVTDMGIGIEPEHIPRLFDRFYRGAGSSCGGTGLGLSICKGLVEAHGGFITVQSRPGYGSKFTVRLPLKEVNLHEGR